MSSESREAFLKRRDAMKLEINKLDEDTVHSMPEREAFFETVYENAKGDAAGVPWADLAAKGALIKWLKDNPQYVSQNMSRAVDVGCGLGDNAEALAQAGYETLGFDFSKKAIAWAKQRFSKSSVSYEEGDLFDLPKKWVGTFDLVHECYTLQSIPPETLEKSIPAVVSLLAPGGILLVYTRLRKDDEDVEGPPWPLEESKASSFADYGLELVSQEDFILEWRERQIPHIFAVWRRKT